MTTRPATLVRRRFLQALGAGAASLVAGPIWRAIPARAGGDAAPRRLLIWYTGNGTVESNWRPTGSESDFVLPRILAPLEPHREHLLLLGPERYDPSRFRDEVGVSIRVNRDSSPSQGHGLAKILTGVTERDFGGVSWGGGISVDQYIANSIGASSPFRSVELGVRVGGGEANSGNRLNYRGPGEPIPPQGDPVQAFRSLFGSFVPPEEGEGMGGDPTPIPSEQALELRRRRSVLDHVASDLSALTPTLAAEQRAMLDAHLTSIRALERRLGPLDGGGGGGGGGNAAAGCTRPDEPGAPTPNSWDEYSNLPYTGETMMDLMAMAFACDLTRVGTLQWGWAAANTRHPWLDANEWFHELSHEPESNVEATEKLIRIHRWYAEQLASMMDRLSAIPEGDGSVLDNTVILWCNELSHGQYHTHQNMPWLLAGSAGGYFRTGRYLQYANRSHNDLLLSLCHAFGLEDETFGDPAFCDGPLPGLT